LLANKFLLISSIDDWFNGAAITTHCAQDSLPPTHTHTHKQKKKKKKKKKKERKKKVNFMVAEILF
jgi:hypothetical protein